MDEVYGLLLFFLNCFRALRLGLFGSFDGSFIVFRNFFKCFREPSCVH